MFVIAVVAGHVGVVAHGGDVVLSTVDNALLHTGVDVAIAHNRGGTAEGIHHVDGHLAVHGADLQTLEVSGSANRGLGGVEAAGAGLEPCKADETVIGSQVVEILADFAVHHIVEMILVVENIGDGDAVPGAVEVGEGTGRDLGHLQLAGLDLADAVGFGAECAAGHDIDDNGAVGGFVNRFGPGGQRDVDGVVLSHVVGEGQVDRVRSTGIDGHRGGNRNDHDQAQDSSESTFHVFPP